VEDSEERKSSFSKKARSLISSIEEDDRVKQAAAATKEAAAQTQEASKSFSRKLTQEDSWEELRGDVEQLTEIARAHHALIVDLIDRVEALETPADTGAGARGGG
jgi:hypothetical protein